MAEEETKGKKSKKRRRRGKGGEEQPGEGEFVAVDDSHVPRYSDSRAQSIGEGSGSERLSDLVVKNHMAKLKGKFNKCIATAAHASPDDLGSGEVDFRLNVEPTGKVSGVNVKAPKNLDVYGIVPCLRVAVHKSKFPTWDGPAMRVDYSFTVG